MPGLLPRERVVAAEIDDHQHGPIDADGPFVVGVAAAEVDHHGHVAHLVELIGVGSLAADDDRAGWACRSSPTTRAGHAGHPHVAIGSGSDLSCSSSRTSAMGASASAAVHQRAAVHLLHQIAQPPPGAAVGQRVAHLVLRREHGHQIRLQLAESPTCPSGASAAQYAVWASVIACLIASSACWGEVGRRDVCAASSASDPASPRRWPTPWPALRARHGRRCAIRA